MYAGVTYLNIGSVFVNAGSISSSLAALVVEHTLRNKQLSCYYYQVISYLVIFSSNKLLGIISYLVIYY